MPSSNVVTAGRTYLDLITSNVPKAAPEPPKPPKSKRERAAENWAILVRALTHDMDEREHTYIRPTQWPAPCARAWGCRMHWFLTCVVYVQDGIIKESEQYEKGSEQRAKCLERLHEVRTPLPATAPVVLDTRIGARGCCGARSCGGRLLATGAVVTCDAWQTGKRESAHTSRQGHGDLRGPSYWARLTGGWLELRSRRMGLGVVCPDVAAERGAGLQLKMPENS